MNTLNIQVLYVHDYCVLSGQHKYQCPHCPYSSIQSSTYKVHLRSKHPKEASQLMFQCERLVNHHNEMVLEVTYKLQRASKFGIT